MFTVATGNAFDGISLAGLFTSTEAAGEWAEANLKNDEWRLIELDLIDTEFDWVEPIKTIVDSSGFVAAVA